MSLELGEYTLQLSSPYYPGSLFILNLNLCVKTSLYCFSFSRAKHHFFFFKSSLQLLCYGIDPVDFPAAAAAAAAKSCQSCLTL